MVFIRLQTQLRHLQSLDLSFNRLLSLNSTVVPLNTTTSPGSPDGKEAVDSADQADAGATEEGKEETDAQAVNISGPSGDPGESFVFAAPTVRILLLNGNNLKSLTGLSTNGFRCVATSFTLVDYWR
jgi:Leucine-rich repeat (LRR) protein